MLGQNGFSYMGQLTPGGLLHMGMHHLCCHFHTPWGCTAHPYTQLALTVLQITSNVSLGFIAMCFQSEPRILLSPHLASGCYTHLMGPVTFAWFLGS